MQKFVLVTVLAVAASLAACSIYRPDINQGQGISYETVSELNEGMTKDEVLDLMGTPLVRDSFHQNRWDYVYYLVDRNRNITQQQNVTLLFEDEVLTSIFHDLEQPPQEPEEPQEIEQQ